MHENTDIDLDAVLGGDAAAIRQFVVTLTPVIQARVARCLRNSTPRDLRQDIQDHCQDVFVHLFADRAQVLRRFDSARGLKLENFIGMVAQRRVVSAMRSAKRNPWRENTQLEDMHLAGPASGDPAGHASDEDEVATLFERLRRTLSPLAWRIFQLLYVQELSVEEVTARTGLSADAIYAWRSRLRKAARTAHDDLKRVTESL